MPAKAVPPLVLNKSNALFLFLCTIVIRMWHTVFGKCHTHFPHAEMECDFVVHRQCFDSEFSASGSRGKTTDGFNIVQTVGEFDEDTAEV
jgi:hypothetical protein